MRELVEECRESGVAVEEGESYRIVVVRAESIRWDDRMMVTLPGWDELYDVMRRSGGSWIAFLWTSAVEGVEYLIADAGGVLYSAPGRAERD